MNRSKTIVARFHVATPLATLSLALLSGLLLISP